MLVYLKWIIIHGDPEIITDSVSTDLKNYDEIYILQFSQQFKSVIYGKYFIIDKLRGLMKDDLNFFKSSNIILTTTFSYRFNSSFQKFNLIK